MLKVSGEKIRYREKPDDDLAYTKKMDKIYSRFAGAYDGFMVVFPLWKKWLRSVLPYLKGERLLEVSFGPAYLLGQYPKSFRLDGLDFNRTMVERAKEKMGRKNRAVRLIEANVEAMPYEDESFDTIVNTMAFSGYPNGQKALSEMLRVLKKDGVLLILDYDYPLDRNIFGVGLVRFIEACGDIIKDICGLLQSNNCSFVRKTISGFGSIQLFIISKNEPSGEA